jgi:hypothetical protein
MLHKWNRLIPVLLRRIALLSATLIVVLVVVILVLVSLLLLGAPLVVVGIGVGVSIWWIVTALLAVVIGSVAVLAIGVIP